MNFSDSDIKAEQLVEIVNWLNEVNHFKNFTEDRARKICAWINSSEDLEEKELLLALEYDENCKFSGFYICEKFKI